MNAVMQLHTDVCDENEVSGSKLTLWDDGLLENYCNEFTINMNKLEEEISNFIC